MNPLERMFRDTLEEPPTEGPAMPRSTADVLRKLADMSEQGMPDDELGPVLWLLGRSMSKQAKPRK